MQILSQVYVEAPSGRLLFRVHRERAAKMVASGEAQAVVERGKVRRIVLVQSTCGLERRDPRPPTVRSYMGQTYTFREALHNPAGEVDSYCTSFRRIHPADRDIFIASVLDCMAQTRQDQRIRQAHGRATRSALAGA